MNLSNRNFLMCEKIESKQLQSSVALWESSEN